MSEANRSTGIPRLPAWLLGLGLVLWGITTGAYVLAIPFAVLVLAPRLLSRRFEFGRDEYHRALDVCWVLFVGGLLLVYSREPMGNVLRSYARWLPAAFFPALMAQAWSSRDSLPLTAILPLPWWRSNADPGVRIDAAPPYFALCVLATCVATPGNSWFFGALALILGQALWIVRRGRAGWVPALLLWLASLGAAWQFASGIARVQQEFETRILAWVSRWRGEDPRGRAASTAIGRTGEVGGGSRIVFRASSARRGPLPDLLRVGTYTAWRGTSWIALQPERERVDGTGDDWVLDGRPGRVGSVAVEWIPHLTDGALPLPSGTRVLGEMAVERLEKSRYGTLSTPSGAGLVSYRADYGPDAAWERPPLAEDRTDIPAKEIPAIQAVAEELGLAGKPPDEVVKILGRFFETRFRYTTDLRDVPLPGMQGLTPLARFLMGSRSGHCEYFATAAVLLLRHAGVPARYARGFLVAAAERDKDVATVREREAHAWVRVWLNERWEDFDPTPSSDGLTPAPAQGWTGKLARWTSDLRFALARWWWLGEKRLLRQAYWLTLPLLLVLLWRFRRVRETPSPDVPPPPAPTLPTWPGTDSEWYLVEAALARGGWQRGDAEPASAWLARLAGGGWPADLPERARSGWDLHQRLRFDPRGLASDERDLLRRTVRDLVTRIPAPAPDA